MKKFFSSLPARLIIGVVAGIALGLFCVDRWMFGVEIGTMIMQVILTLKTLMGYFFL